MHPFLPLIKHLFLAGKEIIKIFLLAFNEIKSRRLTSFLHPICKALFEEKKKIKQVELSKIKENSVIYYNKKLINKKIV